MVSERLDTLKLCEYCDFWWFTVMERKTGDEVDNVGTMLDKCSLCVWCSSLGHDMGKQSAGLETQQFGLLICARSR